MSGGNVNQDGSVDLGPHRYWSEPHGILHVRLVGTVELEHARRIAAAIHEIGQTTGVYLLRDARLGGAITPEAREYIAKNVLPGMIAAIVTYGASFHTRVLVTMITRAIRVFKSTAPMAIFFETEPEARAWIETHRSSKSAQD